MPTILTQLKLIATGGPFDTTQAIRAIAVYLVAVESGHPLGPNGPYGEDPEDAQAAPTATRRGTRKDHPSATSGQAA